MLAGHLRIFRVMLYPSLPDNVQSELRGKRWLWPKLARRYSSAYWHSAPVRAARADRSFDAELVSAYGMV